MQDKIKQKLTTRVMLLHAFQKSIHLTENDEIIESWHSIGLPSFCTESIYYNVAKNDELFDYVCQTFSNHIMGS